MQELVKLAEVREIRAKEEMSHLLEVRAEVYHSSGPEQDTEGGDAVQPGERPLGAGRPRSGALPCLDLVGLCSALGHGLNIRVCLGVCRAGDGRGLIPPV
jgi:hypothetical protein